MPYFRPVGSAGAIFAGIGGLHLGYVVIPRNVPCALARVVDDNSLPKLTNHLQVPKFCVNQLR